MSLIDYRTMSDDEILNLGESASDGPSHEADGYPPVDHWVTIDHRHIPITVPQGKKGDCPPQKKTFFQALGDIFKTMGRAANTDPAFIAALSALESSWLAQHAQERHNPFGLTAGGGNDLSFPSYQAAANYWLPCWPGPQGLRACDLWHDHNPCVCNRPAKGGL